MKTALIFCLLTTTALASLEEKVVTLTLLAEARSESANNYEGMKAVGQVILNRSRNRGLTPRMVCLQPKQFTCWNSPRKLLSSSESIRCESYEATAMAETIAIFVCNGIDVYPGFSANHYFDPDKVLPEWAMGVQGSRIGAHLFIEL